MAVSKSAAEYIKLNKIRLGENHRLSESDDLADLMQSIKTIGLLQPIGVVKEDGGYRVAYGFRRYLAVSKLGLSEIACVVHDDVSEGIERTIHLAENVQRSNATLPEVGRWALKMKEENEISYAELAVSLGVTARFVRSAVEAYQRIPAKYRKAIQDRSSGTQTAVGKISVRQVNAILSAVKSYKLNKDHIEALFSTAKKEGRAFQCEMIHDYAINVKNGKPVMAGTEKHHMVPQLGRVTETEYTRLRTKYVESDKHTYTTMTAVFKAILRGELVEKIKIV